MAFPCDAAGEDGMMGGVHIQKVFSKNSVKRNFLCFYSC